MVYVNYLTTGFRALLKAFLFRYPRTCGIAKSINIAIAIPSKLTIGIAIAILFWQSINIGIAILLFSIANNPVQNNC